MDRYDLYEPLRFVPAFGLLVGIVVFVALRGRIA